MKKVSFSVLLLLLLFVFTMNTYSYYLPPFTFKRGTFLLKEFEFYNKLDKVDSYANIMGFKEQFGLTNSINLYALQPVYVYKKIGAKSNGGFGDLRQGIIFHLFNFNKKDNILFIFTLKVPTGYFEKSPTAKLPTGTGTYDTHFELFGNYFYKIFELRYYGSFIRSFGANLYSSKTEDFITLGEHFFKGKLTFLSTYLYDYSFNTKLQNTTFVQELLYKFSKKIFVKVGIFITIIDNNKVASNYKILGEFYYFFNFSKRS